MKKEVIDKLIRDYFEGETSLHEEEVLRNYFSQAHIADEYKDVAPLFGFFAQERDKNNATQMRRSLKQLKTVKPRTKKSVRIYLSLALAACIALLFVVQVSNWQNEPQIEQSLVYVDGKRMLDAKRMNAEALHSIENISSINDDVLGLQIDLIDSFTE